MDRVQYTKFKHALYGESIIYHDRLYRPSEIAKNGWIVNNNGQGDYKYVLKLIKFKRLKARNVCITGKTYWRVSGKTIVDYRKSLKDDN